MAASVAQEFYKLREEWAMIDKIQSWKLAVWVAEYPDVDIIGKFMDIEQSPIGEFDDIFFRFDSEYRGDQILFEKELWTEFLSWFEPAPKPEMDIYAALLDNGFLTEAFKPNDTLEPTAKNLWNELVRFRACFKDIEPLIHFCLYFPLVPYNPHNIADWLQTVLNKVPEQLRLVTMDFAEDRRVKISLPNSPKSCVYIHPKLDMLNAVKNEMKKDCNNYNTVDPEPRFTQQVLTVMESTTNKINNTTPKEVNKLFEIAKEIKNPSSEIGSLLIAAQAYYAINDMRKSEDYTDQATATAAALMEKEDPSGYPTWKLCMMLKAVILYGRKEYDKAIIIYEQLAETALSQKDAYSIMEARRLTGHIYYELKKNNLAFEYTLLALVAGANVDIQIRRQSTFLHAAYLSLYLCPIVRTSKDEDELKAQLAEWLGDDWQSLLQQEGIEQSLAKRKTSIF